jgi:LacI family transcriptional regulator
MKQRRIWLFGVVFWLNQEFGQKVLSGVLKYCADQYLHEVIFIEARLATKQIHEQVSSLDGMIGILNPTEFGRFKDLEVPKVMVPYFSTGGTLLEVAVDSEMLGVMGATHLLSRGLKHVALVSGWAGKVEMGFRSTVQQAGAEMISGYPTGDGPGEHDQAMDNWIQRLPRPCGIACDHDAVAIKLVDAIRRNGRRTPDDVAVMALSGGLMRSMSCRPTLTNVMYPEERLGWLAAELLDRTCHGKPAQSVRVPPERVIERQSTSKIYLQDNLTSSAVQIIQANIHQPINGASIARELGVSRVTLHRHFTKTLGHGIHDEIAQVRVKRAVQMLTSTDATLKEISYAIGLPQSGNFTRFIKQQTGLTPGQYRKKFRGTTP